MILIILWKNQTGKLQLIRIYSVYLFINQIHYNLEGFMEKTKL
jgi:hypothetical protein